jgi:methyl-accepting chemotaxis protein/sigma-B regulation protein RsbU (phosphoserine phosphatase)
MSKLKNYISQTLSFRLSLRVIAALATLLIVALLIMFYFSRKAVKEEALSHAAQSLEATVNRIDNVLYNVEQATGNMYWRMTNYIHQPEKMEVYAQRLVEDNPYIIGTHFNWNTDTVTVNTDLSGWIEPQNHDKSEALTTFRLPIYDGQKIIGTFDVDVSLTMLSKIMLEGKPSPNSFSVLLGKKGQLIVFPDSTFLNKNAFELSAQYDNNAERDAIQAMVSGETGYKFVRMDGVDCYVFYKPFQRADESGRALTGLGWSVAVIYPEDDIFGDYILLLHMVIVIAIVGLLLLLVSCRLFIHRQFVPLRQLAKSAQRIAEGHYHEPIPDQRRQDEVGSLQRHFQQMQQSLTVRLEEMQHASEILNERAEVLQTAYNQAQAGDRMKMNFLYNMSDQMMAPVGDIADRVMTISEHADEISDEESNRLTDEIQQRGVTITALLNQLISESEKIMS